MVRAYVLAFLRAWLPRLLFVSILSYLLYHGIHGELGFYAWRALCVQDQHVAHELRELRQTRADLRRRVNLLKGDIDPDLLDTVFEEDLEEMASEGNINLPISVAYYLQELLLEFAIHK